MSCCGNYNHNSQSHEDQNQGHKGSESRGTHRLGHNLIMMVCFMIPVAVATALFLFDGFSGSNSLLLLALLVCPLMHLIMMPAMMKKTKNHQD